MAASTASLSFGRIDSWSSGFVAYGAFTALEPLESWSFVIETSATISDIWNARVTAHSGTRYTISSESWNAVLGRGETVEFGFQSEGPQAGFDVVSVNGTPWDDTPPPEALPEVSIARAKAFEDAGEARMRLTLSEAADHDVTVKWAFGRGTADDADHGRPGTRLVTFRAGETEAWITIPLVDDNLKEGDERLWVKLVEAEGADIGREKAPLRIIDDDLPSVKLVNTTALEEDGTARMRVVLSGPAEEDVVVRWKVTSRGTADDDDHSMGHTTRSLTIKAGQTEGFIRINLVDDAVAEPAETLKVKILSAGDLGLAKPWGTLTIEDGDAVEHDGTPFGGADYAEALSLSMQFYYAQYSGDLPDDFPLDWRGDSALTDGADVGRDLSGGWYDAGDHVKFGLPMASSATLLAWGASDYAEGYKASGSYDDILTHLEWVTDYFLRAYDDKGTARLSDDVFYAQVGNGGTDHAYWGAPEDMSMARPAYAVTAQTPGTEVTAETAAALAASSIVFREAGRAGYANELLAAAEKLFAFSEAYQGTYTNAVPDAASYYNSWSGYQDELAWSAAWLHRATGDAEYLAKAQGWYSPSGTSWGLSWDNKSMGTATLLAGEPGGSSYYADLGQHLDHWMNSLARTPGTETNEGLAWLDAWGANRYAANTAFLALEYAGLTEARGGAQARVDAVLDFASDQLDYMLGDNPDGQSYVVGFGDDYPLNPHHRAASGTTNISDPAPNAHTLYGALVGGPDVNGTYTDARTDYVANEVATDYNAGFSGALAGLLVELDLI
ncbi:glycoside hydrolase family 9 protein [Oceanicella sp. SM1341]|uniref:glycoside hydrolase family 9 protein n=1 Tax=Oceanicella sp. SM1341 TaxID=1548889 RepID=UPI000E530130|nr:glycoside hydrolase family 9 protein [Oceanicella sp. SM1341]